jgi:hypothetical protein
MGQKSPLGRTMKLESDQYHRAILIVPCNCVFLLGVVYDLDNWHGLYKQRVMAQVLAIAFGQISHKLLRLESIEELSFSSCHITKLGE